MMNVQELIEMLEDIADEFGGDTEVRFASQPSWPFEYSIDSVHSVDPNELTQSQKDEMLDEARRLSEQNGTTIADELDNLEDLHWMFDAPETPVVAYLVEGQQLAYLNSKAAEVIGWSRE